jgi:hypothetical protein
MNNLSATSKEVKGLVVALTTGTHVRNLLLSICSTDRQKDQ